MSISNKRLNINSAPALAGIVGPIVMVVGGPRGIFIHSQLQPGSRFNQQSGVDSHRLAAIDLFSGYGLTGGYLELAFVNIQQGD